MNTNISKSLLPSIVNGKAAYDKQFDALIPVNGETYKIDLNRELNGAGLNGSTIPVMWCRIILYPSGKYKIIPMADGDVVENTLFFTFQG